MLEKMMEVLAIVLVFAMVAYVCVNMGVWPIAIGVIVAGIATIKNVVAEN